MSFAHDRKHKKKATNGMANYDETRQDARRTAGRRDQSGLNGLFLTVKKAKGDGAPSPSDDEVMAKICAALEGAGIGFTPANFSGGVRQRKQPN